MQLYVYIYIYIDGWQCELCTGSVVPTCFIWDLSSALGSCLVAGVHFLNSVAASSGFHPEI